MKKDYKKYLLSLFQRGAYSKKDLSRKLGRKGCSQEEILSLLDFFEELGYIDDRSYALLFVDSHPDWSSRRIRDELRYRGVMEDYIDHAFEEILVDDEKRAYDLASNWARVGLESRKIYSRLARRGFSSHICRVVSSSVSEVKEPDFPF